MSILYDLRLLQKNMLKHAALLEETSIHHVSLLLRRFACLFEDWLVSTALLTVMSYGHMLTTMTKICPLVCSVSCLKMD